MASKEEPRNCIRPIAVYELVDILSECEHEIVGDLNRVVTYPASLANAKNTEALSFCSATYSNAFEAIRLSRAGVVFCSREISQKADYLPSKTLIAVDNPRLSFMRAIDKYFKPPKLSQFIDPTATIHPCAIVHPTAFIGPNSYVGYSVIGEGTVIYGNVYIYDGVRINKDVVIHAGTVIGGDGFGYERDINGKLNKFTHIGGVIIEDDVEIGSNVSIDRGTLDDTIIGESTKIDNFVHVAHNVVIGKHCAVIAHSMIGGSVKIGDFSWIAPCACLRDKITIGNNVTVGLGAVVTKDVSDGLTVMGSPARSASEYKSLLRIWERNLRR